MEDVSVAVSEQVGGLNISAASRPNEAAAVLLADVQRVQGSTEGGIAVNDAFVLRLQLSSPSNKLALSDVPPFISNTTIQGVLERYGKVTAPIQMIPPSLKNPDIEHVTSFRRIYLRDLE